MLPERHSVENEVCYARVVDDVRQQGGGPQVGQVDGDEVPRHQPAEDHIDRMTCSSSNSSSSGDKRCS